MILEMTVWSYKILVIIVDALYSYTFNLGALFEIEFLKC